MSQQFLKVTFDGGRFTGHSAPVDVLAELATMQQLVFKIARHLYLKRHHNRRRVPRGFPEAAQLYLVAAEANCYTALLERPGTWIGAQTGDLKLFDQARDLALQALEAPSVGVDLPYQFPPAANEMLVAFGKSLEGDERILVGGEPGRAVRVDRASRLKLAELIRQPVETVESLDGEVEQMDDFARTCTLRSREGQRVVLTSFDVAYRETLLEAFRLRPIVRVHLRGQVSAGSPLKVKAVEHLYLYDDERAPEVQKVWERLKSIGQDPDRWIEDDLQPSGRAIQVARGVLGRLLVEHLQLPRPSIFPAPNGAVQAEWILGRWAADIAFDPEDESILAEATHADTSEERCATFNSSQVSADSVSLLGRWLEALADSGGHFH